MAGIWANNNKIEDLFLKHAAGVGECLDVFQETIELYITEGENDQVKELSGEIHQLESAADDVRREIINLLIEEGFLMPHTRRDFLQLLELTDKVADYAEAALDYVILQAMNISDLGRDKLKEILALTIEQYKLLREAVGLLFKDIDQAFKLVLEIDQLESEIDQLERELIRRLSRREDLSPGLKVLYRDFITMIANISDVIEDAGDEIEVIVAMRKV